MSASTLIFSPHELLSVLETLPETDSYYIGFSGGLDSLVLLHAVSQLRSILQKDIIAIHVDHGLHPDAERWTLHCRTVAEALQVQFVSHKVDAHPPRGESPEARARELRYRVFEQVLPASRILLTAHHIDDQAETLLLQLIRGSGAAGLAAMPVLRRFGEGWHARPLLAFKRAQLEQYARGNGLIWMEDTSNRETGYDRNFIRHRILPVLRERWPGIATTLGRAAEIQQDSLLVLNETAGLDLEACEGSVRHALDISRLTALSAARCRNLIRYWLKKQGFPVPDRRRLHEIMQHVLQAKADAEPCVTWSDIEIRRYRNDLLALRKFPAVMPAMDWVIPETLSLPLGRLDAEPVTGGGIKTSACATGRLRVRFREGGETIRRPGQKHHQALKKLFQEAGIPAWLRGYVPLFYINDELVSAGGFWINSDYAAEGDEPGWQLRWDPGEGLAAEYIERLKKQRHS